MTKKLTNCANNARRIIYVSSVCLILQSCCGKKSVDYSVSDYGKSWLSSYQKTSATFKNQSGSIASYVYSEPELETTEVEGTCSGGYTFQDLTMTLSSNDLPDTFAFDLQAYYEGFGDATDEHLTISFPSHCQPRFIFSFANEVVSYGYYVHYADSMILNNTVFYEVYLENSECMGDTVNGIHSVYLTKVNGIVGFQIDSALWVLQ